ncbi:nuclear transport factor 2 family protein [Paenibacillus sp. MWE-103]|uniref:Nuclear transport factor 2 family protein n=1 Tax=Paenibacillus artemisiicola TaxID=1172618 RepID=A0ABS3W3U3_9BACL|nr:nuclear transport factor 2 family protein [Paenibacillus artemisiicola]MBO7742955.1 nuclear transport factor 2 family protein [Paenibacillus artemisiicola]
MNRLPDAVNAYFAAANDGIPDEFLAAFDDQACVLDFKRVFNGKEAIGEWSRSEVFGPKVRFVVAEAAGQDGDYAVIATVDGEFDKTNLPDPLLLKHAFKLSGAKIAEVAISFP